MHEGLTGLLDTADLALAAVREVVGEEATKTTARLIGDARTRLDYPEDVIVAALAGGTGSGKSSLFNAITGTDAAPVGQLRPTTSEPLAATPARHPGAMDGYLDLMEIDRRIEHTDPVVCLVDLPDTDSVVVAHRHRVEEVISRIDVLAWVVDPEKYRDAALHHRYLAPLSEYAGQFIFVLNQIDRLSAAETASVVADLVEALQEDGITDPRVITTSVGALAPATGVEDLRAALHELASRRATLYRKLVSDLGRAAVDLERSIGTPIGYRGLLAPVVDEAASALVSDDLDRATETLSRFCDQVAALVGGRAGEKIGQAAAAIPSLVHQAAANPRADGLSPSRLPWRRRARPPALGRDDAERAIQRLLTPVTAIVTERARAHALVAELAVGVERIRLVVGSRPESPG